MKYGLFQAFYTINQRQKAGAQTAIRWAEIVEEFSVRVVAMSQTTEEEGYRFNWN